MNKAEFSKLLNSAKEDEYGNLYIDNYCDYDKDRRYYFSLITTVCDDLVKEFCSQDSNNNFELYDRHFWNDDTLKALIINNGNPKKQEDY